jgi:hypothetical protein
MRQLLIVLVGLLPKYEPTQRKAIETQALACILRTLLAQSDQGRVKASFQVLVMFLSKQIVTLQQFVISLLDYHGQPRIHHTDSISRNQVLQTFT